MTIDQDKILPVPGVTPSAMTPELRSRLLSAMQEAGDETREFMHEESLLRCLAPAPMPGVVRSRVGVRMHLNALNVRRSLRYGTTRGWRRVAAAAALLALCCTGGGWVLALGVLNADRTHHRDMLLVPEHALKEGSRNDKQ